jgi:hypothetical protein
MKNGHRVSQVQLICSTGGQRKILKQGAADHAEYREVAGVFAWIYFSVAVFVKHQRRQRRIVVAKTFAKMTIGVTALAVTTWFGTSSSRAYGDAPWCAVINLGKDVYWDCQYRTFEACYPNVIGGNRGFCNQNPWPGPSQVIPYKHRKRHSQY